MNGGFRVRPDGQFVANSLKTNPSQKAFQDAGVANKASNEVAATNRSANVSPLPSISLPKGGGAILGIGEKFSANPVTGTGSLNVPIFTSPGRSGFGPQLSLSYDSGSGNGSFGFGWSLSLPSITRKTDKGLPKYQDGIESDVFILSGAEDLVPVFKKGQNGDWIYDAKGNLIFDEEERDGYMVRRYRPRIEGLFARIERWTHEIDGDVHWRSISKDNILTVYGRDKQSRIVDPADENRIFSWLICESYDDKGNAIVYEYKPEDDTGVDFSQASERNRQRIVNRYLKHIFYGNRQPLLLDTSKPSFRKPHTEQTDFSSVDWMFEVVFDYGEGHYIELPYDNDPSKHRFVQASASSAGEWSIRPDPFSIYRACFEVRTYRRCQRVLMFHRFKELFQGFAELENEPYLVRSTEFDYKDMDYKKYEKPVPVEDELEYEGSTHFASFIQSVTQSGYVRDDTVQMNTINGVNYLTYLKKSLPPLEFEYSHIAIQEEIEEIDAVSLENLPCGLDGSSYRWVDLDGEGISGILTEQAEAWFYKPNMGDGKFGPLEKIVAKPSLAALRSGNQQFMDLDGDGHLDLVEFNGSVQGFYERTEDENWENFTPFSSLPNISWKDPNLRFVDLTGDGFADVLITEDDVFTWYQSQAEQGFSQAERVYQALDEEKGPRLVFNDGTQSVYLADMSGDGLFDLVRIRNGEVCYWPNTGYGRFGAKVTMDNSPWFDSPDMFDQNHIRLGDVDGSGTTDIIYLGQDGVQIYFNQSGNRLSSPRRISNFPDINNLSSIQVADLTGNGTACLVWSSPLPGDFQRQMRYIDLMGGQKPHLLIGSKNNLGAETRVHYSMSTKFYLADKASGKPWVTRIPFPVHVVDRVETYDRISRNRFVTRYAYHHGYFDGIEREFRGFGMVEQWDTEEIGTVDLEVTGSEDTNWDAASFVPPVLTRTWFHTGAYFEDGRISKQFEEEYYREGDPSRGEGQLSDDQLEAMLLPDTIFPPDYLTAEETLEACRSLKGGMLRQEIYACDRNPHGTLTEESDRPYTVSERNYTIKLLQPRGSNKHAVFFVHPRETIDFHYERKLYDIFVGSQTQKLADPRVSHSVTLEVDDYGNVLKSIAIGYGRRQPDSNLSMEDQDKQTQTLITYTENQYTNSVLPDPLLLQYDAYRTPLQSETRAFEVLKFEQSSSRFTGITNLFLFDKLKGLADTPDFLQGNWDIPYEDVTHAQATDNHPYRRLIKQMRTLYRSNHLDILLPLGDLDSLALPGETYKLAFMPGLLASVYQRKRNGQPPENLLPNPSAVLGSKDTDGGSYVDLDGNGNWWIPTGRIFYHHDPTAVPSDELTEASNHFFLPRRLMNPFGQNTFVSYDSYDLLPLESEDPLENRVTAGERGPLGIITPKIDYHTLQPYIVTDSNGNRSQVVFDALDMVVGTAVMGKVAENKGDLLTDDFEPNLNEADIISYIQNPLLNPHDILKKATTRLVYDLFAYERTQNDPQPLPAVVYTLVRETHDADFSEGQQTKIQHSFSYSDGFGREIQKKIQAEPEDEKSVPIIPRWVGSGWTIFNNKGKPIKKYEPFFSATHEFEFAKIEGVSSTLFYDPVERVVVTLHPNNSYEKMVFDPWYQETWDVNDTIILDPRTDEDISSYVSKYFATQAANWQTWYQQRINGDLGAEEKKAAKNTEAHANTLTNTSFDVLGRAFLTLANNGKDANGKDRLYKTNTVLDIEGNQREVIDAKERIVMHYDYDMLGNPIKQTNMEAGTRWMLNNFTGKPIRKWDSRGFNRRMTYDALQRPLELFVSVDTGMEFLAKKTEYGESKPGPPLPEMTNHRLKPWRVSDGAGILVDDSYDFKGNLLQSSRQLLPSPYYKIQVDWTQNPQPDDETFISSTSYDALNRPIQIVAPHSSKGKTKTYVAQPVYNEANLLERMDVWLGQDIETNGLIEPNTATKHAVKNIDYNAKGQRELIEYDNGATTSYEYDPLTFRLIHLQTKRGSYKLQDLFYTYDPIGNITFIRDDAQQTIYFNGQAVRPDAEYKYDAIYRLIEAHGREHIGQASQPQTSWDDGFRVNLAHPNDWKNMRSYFEFYTYDEVGNILSFEHQAKSNRTVPASSWVRSFNYNEDSLIETDKKSNRLSSTVVHPDGQNPITEPYTYDSHGNMTSMPHLQQMDWDFEDQLQMVDKGGGSKAYYVYDATGQRVRKVIEQDGTLQEERIYIGGYEVYRKYNGNIDPILERESLHIMDDKQRIALVDTKTIDNQNTGTTLPETLIRYQFGNHLGSAILELDENADIISYEEYYPYGSTSYQAVRSSTLGNVEVSTKRYRYTGKERDWETGLYFHGARYYAPWLGRWASCDPDGIEWEINLYNYASDRPTIRIDSNGRQTEPPAQMHLIEQANIDTVATNSGYSQEKTIQRCVKNVAASWGENPSDYEAGHSSKTPQWSTPPGAPQKIGPQHKLANNLQSQQEALDRAAAVKAGQYARTGRKHTGTPIPNPPPVKLPKNVENIANQNRTQLLANSTRPPKPSTSPLPSPTNKPTPIEQLPLPFGKGNKPVATTPAAPVSEAPPPATGSVASPVKPVGTIINVAGNTAANVVRGTVPGVAEAEAGLMSGAVYAHAAGYTAAGTALETGAAAVPVVGGGLVGGAIVGNLAEAGARELGASDRVAQGTGALAAMATGAGVGALIGAPAGGIGAVPGAIVGGLAGLGGYYLSKVW